jgi:hypothetical protein
MTTTTEPIPADELALLDKERARPHLEDWSGYAQTVVTESVMAIRFKSERREGLALIAALALLALERFDAVERVGAGR